MKPILVNAIIEEAVKDSGSPKKTNTPSNQVLRYCDASKSISQKLILMNEDLHDEHELISSIASQPSRGIRMDSILKAAIRDEHEQDDAHNSFVPFSITACLNYEEQTDWQWSSSERPATFSTRGQIRRGSAHGKGGRLPGSAAQVRKHYPTYARNILYNRLYSILSKDDDSRCRSNNTDVMIHDTADRIKNRANYATTEMLEELETVPELAEFMTAGLSPSHVRDTLIHELQQFAELQVPKSIEHLPRGILGVTARFTKSDFVEPKAARTYHVRERHVITTWLDRKGSVRCTCIGSTQYEIYALNGEFGNSCCMHAQAMTDALQGLCNKLFGYSFIPIRVLYKGFSAIYSETVGSVDHPLPIFESVHGGKTIIFIGEDISGENQMCWIPIRIVQRGGSRPLCAFCDLVDSNQCFHISAFRSSIDDHLKGLVRPTNSNSIEANEEIHANLETESLHVLREPNQSSTAKHHQPISNLSLSPVNCSLAMRVDQEVCDLLKANRVFTLNAPMSCSYCEFPRIESTRDLNTSGVIMCSLGACALEVETYLCSGCRKRFSAEGRKEGVFIDSVCMAATHKLLRDQLTGFALGNGTISSRLSHFHSQVTAFEDARVFNSLIPSRSTRKLYDLCVSFLKLMVRKPSDSLFTCETCQKPGVSNDREEGGSLRAVCVDGIWAGYQRKTVVPFQNVSQPCTPLKTFSRSVKSSLRNPQTSFFRLEKAVSYLLSAIKGKPIEASHTFVNALVAAVRVTSEDALPAGFYVSSICGTFPTDYKNDIGEGYLKSLRGLTNALFHRETLLYRLLEPLQKLFQRQRKRRKTLKPSQKKSQSDDEVYRIVTYAISKISNLSQEEEGVAWNDGMKPFVNEADFGRKLLRLYTAMLQGPLTHLIKRTEIPSAADTANACIHMKPNEFMRAMVSKRFTFISGSNTESEVTKDSEILHNLRILAAGLFCASVVDKNSCDAGKHTQLLILFGYLLLNAVQLVERFYSFYDSHLSNGGTTAAKYARDWQSRNFHELREKFKTLSESNTFQPPWGIDYDDPFVTGAYFPSLPQVRPLPFNDQKGKIVEVDSYGFCSKHYLQRNASFTPGALTFSCSCSHPKVLGFKVLERDEGPRAVLDVLVSRFASLPPFVIYDFACGVYKSAINALWWVVESSTLVSDPFHANNHTCSAAFVPSAHVKLNMLNTISHEQRNRPIAKIKNSLQQTGQDVYISLLAYQIIINNIEAKGRRAEEEQFPVSNRSAKDIEWAFFHRLGMNCCCCIKAKNS